MRELERYTGADEIARGGKRRWLKMQTEVGVASLQARKWLRERERERGRKETCLYK